MDITARKNLIGGNFPPARIYFHGPSLNVYEDNLQVAKNYTIGILEKHAITLSAYQYLIAVTWGDKSIAARYIDLCGLVIDKWDKNPEWDIGLLWNGHFTPKERVEGLREAACGDGMIVFGQEEDYRRGTNGIDEFMLHPPQITEKGIPISLEEIQ